MHIVVLGLNHQTAPVEIREKLSLSTTDFPAALSDLMNRKSILECVILSTCNRTEIYAVVDKLQRTKHYIHSFIEDRFGISRDQFQAYLYTHEEDAAVRHLFRVTSGLDSMIIGETQILGQVRNAFLLAQQEKTTGTWFNKLFKEAITLAKRAHMETAIAEHPASVSYAAIELGRQMLGTLEDKSVMVIGAGKMSELSLKHLNAREVKELFVLNRTYKQAIRLAEQFNGIPYPFEKLEELLPRVDMIVSSTSAPNYVITAEMMTRVLPQRQGRPLFMLDIAVPRDLDPAISELEHVHLHDIDDLHLLLDQHLEKRKSEAQKIESMIEVEIGNFQSWLATLEVVPVIQALQNKASSIYEETITNLFQKLPHLDERDRKVIGKLTKSIMNQMMRDPILRIKEMSAEQNGDEALNYFIRFFGLEEQLKPDSEDLDSIEPELRIVT